MAQRSIVCIVPDLFVGLRIEEAGKVLGARVETVAPQDAAGLLGSLKPAVVVVDLAAPGLDLNALATVVGESGAALIGFYPHVDNVLRQKARSAGVAHIYPRSRFLRELRDILKQALGD